MDTLQPVHEFPQGITAIDTGYVRPLLDASHLILRDGRAAFVDTGTSHSVPRLLGTLQMKQVDPADVDYVFLTHIHLDHAGGAGELLKYLPNAMVLVHPRGLPHMAAPAKLIEGTRAVYGEAEFRRLYGNIPPIAAERLIEVPDGLLVKLGQSDLLLIHTPGHALHHYSIVDPASSSIFTGDTFGISYRVFDTDRGPFIFPATTPVHFDPEQAHASLDRIMGFEPEACFLTHYSRVGDLGRLADDMHACLDAFVEIGRNLTASSEARIGEIREKMHAYLLGRVREHGCILDPQTVDRWLEMDVELNAKGLAVWLERKKN